MEHSNSTKPSLVTRVFLGLIGSNPERASWAGHDDQARVRLLGASVTLLAAWVGFNVANAVQYATGDGFLDLRVIAISLLIAGLYVAVDIALLQGRIWTNGVRMAAERGFAPVQRPAGKRVVDGLGALPFAGLRLGLALSVALFAAFSFGLWYWEKDITARLHADHIAANAAVRQRIEAEIEARMEGIGVELDQIAARMSARAARAARLSEEAEARLQAVNNANLEQLSNISSRISAIDTRISCVSRNVVAEERGLTDCSGVQRTAGQGARWRAAKAELEQLEADRTGLVEERDRLEAALTVEAHGTGNVVEPDPEAARHEALVNERNLLAASRPETVQALLTADPAFVPMADGLLTRQKALTSLALEQPEVLFVMILTKLMFVLLDLSLVAIAFGGGHASIYGLKQVVETETRAADEVSEGCVMLAQSNARRMEAEIAQLQTQLGLLKAQREVRAEMRRMTISDAVLDQWSEQATHPNPPRYDA